MRRRREVRCALFRSVGIHRASGERNNAHLDDGDPLLETDHADQRVLDRVEILPLARLTQEH